MLELGCGPAGGFVPSLLASGYEAIGIDRNAPAGPAYRQADFERYTPPEPIDAIVASRSLHHVGDLARCSPRARDLRPGGSMIVAEWDWERFDEATALVLRAARRADGRARLAAAAPAGMGRLGHAGTYEGWACVLHGVGGRLGHDLHPPIASSPALDRRRTVESVIDARGPYAFIADLEGRSPRGFEQAAIDAGEINATGVRYLGTAAPGRPGRRRERASSASITSAASAVDAEVGVLEDARAAIAVDRHDRPAPGHPDEVRERTGDAEGDVGARARRSPGGAHELARGAARPRPEAARRRAARRGAPRAGRPRSIASRGARADGDDRVGPGRSQQRVDPRGGRGDVVLEPARAPHRLEPRRQQGRRSGVGGGRQLGRVADALAQIGQCDLGIVAVDLAGQAVTVEDGVGEQSRRDAVARCGRRARSGRRARGRARPMRRAG